MCSVVKPESTTSYLPRLGRICKMYRWLCLELPVGLCLCMTGVGYVKYMMLLAWYIIFFVRLAYVLIGLFM